jgi:chromate transporter
MTHAALPPTNPLPSFKSASWVWLQVALQSFGGPAAQIAVMHREIVARRGWVEEERFLHALNFCMLLPGPEAQQLATYLGWLLHGVRGGLVAGILFVLPGALVMLLLSICYAEFGHTAAVSALFFGLKAAVLALVVEALIRISRRALRRPEAKYLALAGFLALFAFGLPFPAVIAAAAAFGAWRMNRPVPGTAATGSPIHAQGKPVAAKQPAAAEFTGRAADRAGPAQVAASDPRTPAASRRGALCAALVALLLWLLPLAGLHLALGPSHVLAQQARFFSQAALVTFGGAYAVLSYISSAAVETFGWLSAGAMIDGLGLAETTPGPLILVVQFVGFLGAYGQAGQLPPILAGCLGALVTLWVTFAPCFFWIFLGAPFIERLRGQPRLDGALAAITAAVVGVIANLFARFGLQVLFERQTRLTLGPLELPWPELASLDLRSLAIAIAAGIALWRGLALGWILLGAALLGSLVTHLNLG